MDIETTEDLYHFLFHNLQTTRQYTLDALPGIAGAARAKMLQSSLLEYFEESKRQLERLDRIMVRLGESVAHQDSGSKSRQRTENETQFSIEAKKENRDSRLDGVAQQIQHHEIAMYGCLQNLASLIDQTPNVRKLDTNAGNQLEAGG
jgi:ferritin-like metal-binding protein YciE